MRVLAAAVLYFLLAMVAGFVFGAARELLFIPALDRPWGDLVETPFMLGAIVASAWAALRLVPLSPAWSVRLTMGLVSLGLVLAAETVLSIPVRGSVQAWLDSFTPATLTAAVLLWAVHALAPAVLARRI